MSWLSLSKCYCCNFCHKCHFHNVVTHIILVTQKIVNACDTCEKRCHFLRLSWMSYLCHVYPVGHKLVTHIVTSVASSKLLISVFWSNFMVKCNCIFNTQMKISLHSMMMMMRLPSPWTIEHPLTENICLQKPNEPGQFGTFTQWPKGGTSCLWTKLYFEGPNHSSRR